MPLHEILLDSTQIQYSVLDSMLSISSRGGGGSSGLTQTDLEINHAAVLGTEMKKYYRLLMLTDRLNNPPPHPLWSSSDFLKVPVVKNLKKK